MMINLELEARVGMAMVNLAQDFPGFPVALFWDGFLFHVGVIGVELEPDDWFILPAEASAIIVTQSPESIALKQLNKKPQNAAADESDPGGTRTLNQLIKSQLPLPASAKDK